MSARASAAAAAGRVRVANAAPVARGEHVVYWMIAARRTTWSFGLDHAIARAAELGVPLIVLEPLRAGYPWASDRLHRFVLDGMAATARACTAAGVAYHPYVEPEPGAGKGLLAALAARASLVVTDEWPSFFVPRMVAAAARALPVRVEVVDGNGLLPLAAHERAFPTAVAFRRHWQRVIHPHLIARPKARPLAHLPRGVAGATIPGPILRRWPPATAALLAGDPRALAALPIDHAVAPVAERGGSEAAAQALDRFVAAGLRRFADERDEPTSGASSSLSTWLHFGHLAAHEVIARVWDDAGWDPARVAGAAATGSREGWWGLPPSHEAYLDQIVTWRELGFGFGHHHPDDHDRYESLPGWARASLDAHAADPRPVVYDLATLDGARTHDELWNAAQRQLVRDGRIHNYLRMLWGKKILEWSATPRAALAAMIELNNRYAVDGRDPNSYSGIFWTLGRFDRPWPERPIYGVIRYMTSQSTARKLHVKEYLAAYRA